MAYRAAAHPRLFGATAEQEPYHGGGRGQMLSFAWIMADKLVEVSDRLSHYDPSDLVRRLYQPYADEPLTYVLTNARVVEALEAPAPSARHRRWMSTG